MILIPAKEVTVGTDAAERELLGRRFDCHPTWLGDDLEKHKVSLSAFWIDRYPVTNAQYYAFVKATGHNLPRWWSRWNDQFPAEYANHPVTGISGLDATAYAQWADKRLLTAEEWEAAMSGPTPSLFAWGDDWPGPIKLQDCDRIFWELPGTRPVGTGGCGKSMAGVEDFSRQVLECVSDKLPYHNAMFQLLKGASWFHQDPVNFRIASGYYVSDRFTSSLIGFRCAMDGDKAPPKTEESIPSKTISYADARKQLLSSVSDDQPTLYTKGGVSRSLKISVPAFGPETINLFAPEGIMWNDQGILHYYDNNFDIMWSERTDKRAAHQMRFKEILIDAEFCAFEDSMTETFTVTNQTSEPGIFHASSCFNLQQLPMFYDCEMLRTYVLNTKGKFVPLRQLSRVREQQVRWISGPDPNELGKDLRWAVMAVVSKDGKAVIATGKAGKGKDFSVANNAMFTCLHPGDIIEVDTGQKATDRQYFWFLKGTLEDLRLRCRKDLGIN